MIWYQGAFGTYCLEEEACLVYEKQALQVWFSEEWKIVTDGCQATGA
jgi:hypothetical protein